jgi:hypothetical protein
MNEDKAAVALRFNIRALIGPTPSTGASLSNIITNIYPDGALCFVLENRALYELNKESTGAPDNLTIVAPIAGPGRWLLLGQSAGAATLAAIVGTATNAVTTSGTANFVPVDDSNFDWQPTGAPPGFTLTATGGIISYNGVIPVLARLTFTGSVEVSAESGGQIWAAIDHNADVLGTDPTTSFTPGTQTTVVGGTGLPGIISSQRTLLLTPGDAVQIALAAGVREDLILDRATLSVLLA